MKKIKFKKYTTNFELNLIDDILITDSEIEKIIDNFEMVFSRFKSDSELSKLNKNWGWEVSPLFLKLFNLNIHLNKLTKWFFNPFINIENIWYSDKKLKDNKNQKIEFEENYILNWNKLIIKNNANIDFWWSAKWFLVDLLSDYLKNKWAKNFFINFGWDIYFSWKKENEKWIAWIANPFKIWENLWFIKLENLSISSSWNYKRNWEIDGKKYHHILNPKTQENENEIVMISIIWKNTYFTDSIATSVFNMWIKSGLDFLNENKIDWIIIWEDKKYYLTNNFQDKYEIKI